MSVTLGEHCIHRCHCRECFTFFGFFSLLTPLLRFPSNFGCSRVLLLFSFHGFNVCNFCSTRIVKISLSLKPLAMNQLHLVWRVPRGPSL